MLPKSTCKDGKCRFKNDLVRVRSRSSLEFLEKLWYRLDCFVCILALGLMLL